MTTMPRCTQDIEFEDLDGDGHLDIILCAETILVFDGPDYTSASQEVQIPYEFSGSGSCIVDDFDQDGELDLIIEQIANDHRLFWGRDGLWSADDSIALEPEGTFTIRSGGYWEIIFPSYLSDELRNAEPSRIYHGSADGWSTENMTQVGVGGVASVLVVGGTASGRSSD